MNHYHELKTVSLDASDQIARPEQLDEYSLDTPAMAVVTDFQKVQPLMMELDVTLDAARHMMRKVHVRSVLVIDAHENFRGLLTVADLDAQLALSITTTTGVQRNDITIKEMMTPRDALRAVPLAEIQRARIGDLVRTLEHEGTPHVLVVDTINHQLCGVISASDIARRLKVPVDILKRAASFREVVAALFAGRDT
ncbi:MAG: CBS domain-containing protein [Motiliproteus sp.]